MESKTLSLYRILSAQASMLDGGDDDMAELIRCVLDFIWFRRLTESERKQLDADGTTTNR